MPGRLRLFSGRSRHRNGKTVHEVPPTDAGEARDAVEKATARLSEDRGRWPEVRRRAETLRHTYEENHFAERVRDAFGGRA